MNQPISVNLDELMHLVRERIEAGMAQSFYMLIIEGEVAKGGKHVVTLTLGPSERIYVDEGIRR